MIKLVWRTDVHLSDKAPSARKDDWVEAVFDNLTQVREIAASTGASAILDGGDFFHIKSPNRNSHELVRRTLEHHSNYPCPVYCTPGNHDSVYGDYAFLPQQPLGVLYASGLFKRLYDDHEALFIDPSSGLKVRVVGIPYHGTKYDMGRFKTLRKGDEDWLVCVAHVLASAKGGSMFEGEDIIRYEDLASTAPDVFCFGHWHKNQGITTMGGKHIINIGSLTRGTLSQDDLTRIPSCAVMSFTLDGVDIKAVELDVKPPEEVFDLDRRSRDINKSLDMDAFIGSLSEGLMSQNSLSLIDSVRGMSIDSHVKEKALIYLERTSP
jgi:DNA repair exonuclease SbcCD nuclease subunit